MPRPQLPFPITAKNMTTKEKVLSVINSLDENASLDEVIDRLYLLRKIELGIAQADAGDVIEHDQFMDVLERKGTTATCKWRSRK